MEIVVYVFYIVTMAFVTITSIYLMIKDKDDRGSDNNAEYKYSNPDKQINKTNRFNNQFIIQRIKDNEQMQCVTCGSIKVSARLSYSSENRSSERIYSCDKCGNKYRTKGSD